MKSVQTLISFQWSEYPAFVERMLTAFMASLLNLDCWELVYPSEVRRMFTAAQVPLSTIFTGEGPDEPEEVDSPLDVA